MVLLDPEGKIEWCNQTAALHLGMDAKRDLMQHVIHLVRDPVFMKYLSSEIHEDEVVIDGRNSSFQKLLSYLCNFTLTVKIANCFSPET